MPDEKAQQSINQQPPDGVEQTAAAQKPLVTVHIEREVDISTGEGRTHRYIKMYFEARDSGLLAALGDRRWRTLCVLATYMDENGNCFPSQAKIAADLGVHRQRVNERIKELEVFRFNSKPVLSIQKTRDTTLSGGRWANNVYFIHPVASLQFGASQQAKEATTTHNQEAEIAEESSYVRKSGHRPVSGSQDTGNPDTNKSNRVNKSNVNVIVNQQRKKTTEPPVRPIAPMSPRVSWPALQKKWGLDEKQCGEVSYLVEQQANYLGAGERNHAYYVKRAAEAVVAKLPSRLIAEIRSFDEQVQQAKNPPKSKPAVFHRRWQEVLANAQRRKDDPLGDLVDSVIENVSGKTQPTKDTLDNLDPTERQRRNYLAQLDRQGYQIPEHVRRASIKEIGRWHDQQAPPKEP